MTALLDSKKALVLSILEEHFGDIVRDVAHFLLNTANVTLTYLIRSFGDAADEQQHLSANEVHFALRQLLRHGYLLVETPPSNFKNSKEERASELELVGELNSGKNRQLPYLYSINIDQVLHRLRFGRAVEIVFHNTEAQNMGVLLLEEVLEKGRVTIDHLESLVKARMEEELGYLHEASGEDEVSSTEVGMKNFKTTFLETFDRLVKRQIIMQAPYLKPITQRSTAMKHKSAKSVKKKKQNDGEGENSEDDDFTDDENSEILTTDLPLSRNGKEGSQNKSNGARVNSAAKSSEVACGHSPGTSLGNLGTNKGTTAVQRIRRATSEKRRALRALLYDATSSSSKIMKKTSNTDDNKRRTRGSTSLTFTQRLALTAALTTGEHKGTSTGFGPVSAEVLVDPSRNKKAPSILREGIQMLDKAINGIQGKEEEGVPSMDTPYNSDTEDSIDEQNNNGNRKRDGENDDERSSKRAKASSHDEDTSIFHHLLLKGTANSTVTGSDATGQKSATASNAVPADTTIESKVSRKVSAKGKKSVKEAKATVKQTTKWKPESAAKLAQIRAETLTIGEAAVIASTPLESTVSETESSKKPDKAHSDTEEKEDGEDGEDGGKGL